LRQLHELLGLGCPLLVGLSRKSLIGALTGAPVEQRLAGSVALAVMAAWSGARMVRVHDVAETVQALRVHDALRYGVEH
jgi:dihydropteroate synthase